MRRVSTISLRKKRDDFDDKEETQEIANQLFEGGKLGSSHQLRRSTSKHGSIRSRRATMQDAIAKAEEEEKEKRLQDEKESEAVRKAREDFQKQLDKTVGTADQLTEMQPQELAKKALQQVQLLVDYLNLDRCSPQLQNVKDLDPTMNEVLLEEALKRAFNKPPESRPSDFFASNLGRMSALVDEVSNLEKVSLQALDDEERQLVKEAGADVHATKLLMAKCMCGARLEETVKKAENVARVQARAEATAFFSRICLGAVNYIRSMENSLKDRDAQIVNLTATNQLLFEKIDTLKKDLIQLEKSVSAERKTEVARSTTTAGPARVGTPPDVTPALPSVSLVRQKEFFINEIRLLSALETEFKKSSDSQVSEAKLDAIISSEFKRDVAMAHDEKRSAAQWVQRVLRRIETKRKHQLYCRSLEIAQMTMHDVVPKSISHCAIQTLKEEDVPGTAAWNKKLQQLRAIAEKGLRTGKPPAMTREIISKELTIKTELKSCGLLSDSANNGTPGSLTTSLSGVLSTLKDIMLQVDYTRVHSVEDIMSFLPDDDRQRALLKSQTHQERLEKDVVDGLENFRSALLDLRTQLKEEFSQLKDLVEEQEENISKLRVMCTVLEASAAGQPTSSGTLVDCSAPAGSPVTQGTKDSASFRASQKRRRNATLKLLLENASNIKRIAGEYVEWVQQAFHRTLPPIIVKSFGAVIDRSTEEQTEEEIREAEDASQLSLAVRQLDTALEVARECQYFSSDQQKLPKGEDHAFMHESTLAEDGSGVSSAIADNQSELREHFAASINLLSVDLLDLLSGTSKKLVELKLPTEVNRAVSEKPLWSSTSWKELNIALLGIAKWSRDATSAISTCSIPKEIVEKEIVREVRLPSPQSTEGDTKPQTPLEAVAKPNNSTTKPGTKKPKKKKEEAVEKNEDPREAKAKNEIPDAKTTGSDDSRVTLRIKRSEIFGLAGHLRDIVCRLAVHIVNKTPIESSVSERVVGECVQFESLCRPDVNQSDAEVTTADTELLLRAIKWTQDISASLSASANQMMDSGGKGKSSTRSPPGSPTRSNKAPRKAKDGQQVSFPDETSGSTVDSSSTVQALQTLYPALGIKPDEARRISVSIDLQETKSVERELAKSIEDFCSALRVRHAFEQTEDDQLVERSYDLRALSSTLRQTLDRTKQAWEAEDQALMDEVFHGQKDLLHAPSEHQQHSSAGTPPIGSPIPASSRNASPRGRAEEDPYVKRQLQEYEEMLHTAEQTVQNLMNDKRDLENVVQQLLLSLQPPVQDAQSRFSVQEVHSPPVQEAQSRPPVQEAESRPPVQEAQSRPPVQETQSRPPVQETQSRPPVQETQSRPPVQETQSRPPVQEAQNLSVNPISRQEPLNAFCGPPVMLIAERPSAVSHSTPSGEAFSGNVVKEEATKESNPTQSSVTTEPPHQEHSTRVLEPQSGVWSIPIHTVVQSTFALQQHGSSPQLAAATEQTMKQEIIVLGEQQVDSSTPKVAYQESDHTTEHDGDGKPCCAPGTEVTKPDIVRNEVVEERAECSIPEPLKSASQNIVNTHVTTGHRSFGTVVKTESLLGSTPAELKNVLPSAVMTTRTTCGNVPCTSFEIPPPRNTLEASSKVGTSLTTNTVVDANMRNTSPPGTAVGASRNSRISTFHPASHIVDPLPSSGDARPPTVESSSDERGPSTSVSHRQSFRGITLPPGVKLPEKFLPMAESHSLERPPTTEAVRPLATTEPLSDVHRPATTVSSVSIPTATAQNVFQKPIERSNSLLDTNGVNPIAAMRVGRKPKVDHTGCQTTPLPAPQEKTLKEMIDVASESQRLMLLYDLLGPQILKLHRAIFVMAEHVYKRLRIRNARLTDPLDVLSAMHIPNVDHLLEHDAQLLDSTSSLLEEDSNSALQKMRMTFQKVRASIAYESVLRHKETIMKEIQEIHKRYEGKKPPALEKTNLLRQQKELEFLEKQQRSLKEQVDILQGRKEAIKQHQSKAWNAFVAPDSKVQVIPHKVSYFVADAQQAPMNAVSARSADERARFRLHRASGEEQYFASLSEHLQRWMLYKKATCLHTSQKSMLEKYKRALYKEKNPPLATPLSQSNWRLSAATQDDGRPGGDNSVPNFVPIPHFKDFVTVDRELAQRGPKLLDGASLMLSSTEKDATRTQLASPFVGNDDLVASCTSPVLPSLRGNLQSRGFHPPCPIRKPPVHVVKIAPLANTLQQHGRPKDESFASQIVSKVSKQVLPPLPTTPPATDGGQKVTTPPPQFGNVMRNFIKHSFT